MTVQRLMRCFWLLFISGLFLSCAHRSTRLCGNIHLREGHLSLNRNEKTLICGNDEGTPAWKEVPLPQAQYLLQVRFQKEGYLNPRFQREKDQLYVWAGPRKRIESFVVSGGDGIVEASRKRQVVGEPLVPEKLDEVKEWADSKMRMEGFACPQVNVQAQAWDGKVTVDLLPGLRTKIASLDRSGLQGIDNEALARYTAFDIGDTYDVRDTQLTVSRLLSDGLVQSAYFSTECRDKQVHLRLQGMMGPARMFRFEVGASTEEFPFTDITFKNARVDERASSYTLILHASPRLQSLTGTSQLYVIPWTQRSYLGPRFRLARESEQAYEVLRAETGVDVGRQWDMWHQRWDAKVGPTARYVRTVQGLGPEDVSYLSFDGSINVMSHAYESSTRNQYEGWQAGFAFHGQQKGLGSEVDVRRYDFNIKSLWNLGKYAPPFLVLGTRLEATGVDVDQVGVGTGNDVLPIDYRIFYGGAENLRGFARKTLTNGDAGYLTSAYLGLELRLVEELPWNIQPLILYDVARLGSSSFKLDDPIFTSLGGGLRWASPFGTIRASAARGDIANEDTTTAAYRQTWVYFVSFGMEF